MMKKYPLQVIFREYFEGILAAVFLALFLRLFVVSILYMPTGSMQPNLYKGDFIIGWKLAYGFPLPLMGGDRLNSKLPSRGQLVSFRFPGDIEQMVVRRVIGLPGDRISVEEGRLIVNGRPLEYIESEDGETLERWPEENLSYAITGTWKGKMEAVDVPDDAFFVLSDQRSHLDDSRTWGVVPLRNLDSLVKVIWLSVDNSQRELTLRWPRMFHWL